MTRKWVFPIKAYLTTHDSNGKQLKKKKLLPCWVAFSESPMTVEVALTKDGEPTHQDISIDFNSLLKEVKKHDASK